MDLEARVVILTSWNIVSDCWSMFAPGPTLSTSQSLSTWILYQSTKKVEKIFFIKYIFSIFRDMWKLFTKFLGHGLDVENIVDDEVETIIEMKKDCGKFENISFVNNESDPEKSWWRPESWRAEVEYPLTVARNIYNHRQKYFNGGGPR